MNEHRLEIGMSLCEPHGNRSFTIIAIEPTGFVRVKLSNSSKKVLANPAGGYLIAPSEIPEWTR